MKILAPRDATVDIPQAVDAVTYVSHGSTAGTARPSVFAAVVWVGSVEPTNAVNGDIWIDTA